MYGCGFDTADNTCIGFFCRKCAGDVELTLNIFERIAIITDFTGFRDTDYVTDSISISFAS